MTIIIRLVGALALFASALPLVVGHAVKDNSKSCKGNEFWYKEKSCCLPHGGTPSPPSPPKGHDCPPTGYYWGKGQGCCVPSHPPPENHPPPQCRKDWDWYPALHMCLPHPTHPSPPPSHPSGHSGHGGKGDHGGKGGHGGGKDGHGGDKDGHGGDKDGHGGDKGGHGGDKDGHGGDKGGHGGDKDGHGGDKGGHGGDKGGHGGYGGWRKRNVKSRTSSLCPSGLDACPISNLSGGDYECIDTAAELESCGGCTSLGQGQDCTSIVGAWNVGCEQGHCAVYTCSAGFRRAHDGKSCIPL